MRIDELRLPSADRAEADLDVALAATPSEEGSHENPEGVLIRRLRRWRRSVVTERAMQSPG